MSILRTLEKINETNDKEKIQLLLDSLWRKNAAFRRYLCLAYAYAPNFKKVPKHTTDTSPAGMHYSSLEQALKTFEHIAYKQSKPEVYERQMIQLCENLNKLEVEFLQQVLQGKIKHYGMREIEKSHASL